MHFRAVVHGQRFCTHIRNMSRHKATCQPVKVQVNPGVVVGRSCALPNGGQYNSFQGIPYAVPPLGALRFKSPVPLERFDVPELDCTKERDKAHQRDMISASVVGSENCLFLNVYAPDQRRGPLPVMVWIHGGGFWFGNGNSEYNLPLALMQEDVVVVTLNYRLGALGFLYLPEEGIWGNAGLKDQRLALQWVQDNIAHFNGDPQNVTIFGVSAGAASVHLHAVASHSKVLFHKAIMQSGTANMEWVFRANAADKTRRLAQLLGCQLQSSSDILRFLQSEEVTPMRILAATLPVLTPDERRRGLPLPFKPVIEDSASPDAFINRPILDVLQEPDSLAIPTIVGYNSAEGITMTVNAKRKLPEVEKDLARFVPRDIPLATTDPAVQMIAQKMRDFYLRGQPLSPALYDALTELLSDYHFIIDAQKAAEYQARLQPRAPLYFYRFEYVGGRNMYKQLLQMEDLFGACHGDELLYLFQMAGDDSPLSADDALISRRLCRLWANFARHGEPTPHGAEPPLIDAAWTAVARPASRQEPFRLDYLAIDKQCAMRSDPEKERMDFWRNIYKDFTATDYSRLSAKL